METGAPLGSTGPRSARPHDQGEQYKDVPIILTSSSKPDGAQHFFRMGSAWHRYLFNLTRRRIWRPAERTIHRQFRREDPHHHSPHYQPHHKPFRSHVPLPLQENPASDASGEVAPSRSWQQLGGHVPGLRACGWRLEPSSFLHVAAVLQTVFEPLFEDQLVMAAGRRSQWARRRRIDLADLIDEPWAHCAGHVELRSCGAGLPRARARHAEGQNGDHVRASLKQLRTR